MENDLVNTIIGLEQALLGRETRQSASRLEALIADDFLEIGASGKFHDKEAMVRLLPDAPDIHFITHDLQAKEVSPGTVLLTYELEMKTPRHRATLRSQRSSLWMQRGDRWQIVFHQGTPL
jgi:glyoxylase I family protein